MKKLIGRRILLGGGLLFVALQFVRPEKNLGPPEPGPESLEVRLQAPPEVRRMLDIACNDCHSDHTRYPWYFEIQPAGWFLARHVQAGKRALNLSEFGQLGARAQAKRLQYMVAAMREREMPLPSYVWLHRDAQLSDAQILRFAAWAEAVPAQP
jgi:hypothetical protein